MGKMFVLGTLSYLLPESAHSFFHLPDAVLAG